MPVEPSELSSLTINRLSVYLRCLRRLQAEGVERISSQEFGRRFHLSPSQIRRDLATIGQLGVRGVGYDVAQISADLHRVLRLDDLHRLVVVGMGNLGSALSSYVGFNDGSFRVVAAVDSDPELVGTIAGGVVVEPYEQLAEVARRSEADIGIIAVPAEAAQDAYARLVEGGVRSVLNFAPRLLEEAPGVRLRNVDMRIHLEELAALSGTEDSDGPVREGERPLRRVAGD